MKPDRRSIRRATKLLQDGRRTLETLGLAARKAQQNKNALTAIWDDFTSLFRIVKSWKMGTYREVPWNTVLLSTGAIVYFLSPIDLVPDVIPVLGLIDDVAVIRWVIVAVRTDLEKFRLWERTHELEPAT